MSEDETRKELRQVSKIVEFFLETEERARNDDKYLTYKVMSCYTNIYIPFEDFAKIPAFETIKRVRAKIQNKQGRFPPTDFEVLKKRKHKQAVIESWAVE